MNASAVERAGVPSSAAPERPPLRLVQKEPSGAPSRRFGVIALVGVLAVVAMLASGFGVYLWQHGQVADLRADVATLQGQMTTQRGQLGTVQQQLTASQSRLASAHATLTHLRATASGLRVQALDLERRLAATTARRNALADLLSKARGHNQALAKEMAAVTAARDSLSSQLAATQADLQAVDGRLLVLAGPTLADGRYFGPIFAAANTVPPRLAFVVASTVASTETAEPGWRVLQVAPRPPFGFSPGGVWSRGR